MGRSATEKKCILFIIQIYDSVRVILSMPRALSTKPSQKPKFRVLVGEYIYK